MPVVGIVADPTCPRVVSWPALHGSVQKNGKVGWIQPIGHDPRKNFGPDSWEVYGTGAFLPAGNEMVKLLGGEHRLLS